MTVEGGVEVEGSVAGQRKAQPNKQEKDVSSEDGDGPLGFG